MKTVFAPGCALMIYKPDLGRKILAFLDKEPGGVNEHLTCCRHEPGLAAGTRIINVCAGCDRRYRQLYEGITTVSLWEVLAESGTFPFPDYQAKEMTVLDACPTRDQERIHTAVRALLARMNIKVVEPEKTRIQGGCCGDSFYGTMPAEQVKEKMRSRAGEMPVEDVVVYCVSCCKAMHIGGKKPRYLVDLLLGEETGAGTFEPDEWHAELDRFIDGH
ncbi:MAG: (Fe-S)-binding protein [Negativicutes bacterium]|nr:(Fe-S)-binding protein [Negativicutes bacterium]